ncbi:hypothetical protein GPY51_10555 [Photorhabdus laumondii subsp. laumondii]|uniref:Uncharacterized protein n=3 Tax=Photorhabdus TaxID=29487 RepID=A0ABX0AYV4_9GAMM|nr:hypothetical protein [Photorhabdus laumondii subsp. laumondii]NDK97631.1 hypothetical protein [Photorhabdus bodei]NDL12162.1 hypothetical protein [Photorhabdus kayaii]NDL01880.1 hypothetical protein [Photorhabdus bodei]NDL05954.1 hypothetical protein [Photorhabdus bodei]
MLRTPTLQTFPPETLSLDELVPKNHLYPMDFEMHRGGKGANPREHR